MRGLGISVYPNHGSLDEIVDYIDMAAALGFERIFTCLISAEDKSTDEVVDEFKKITSHANCLGMKVTADVEPAIFKKFGASYKDLSFFKDLGLYGIRLDLGFGGIEESAMTYNPYGMKIELNMSNGTKYLDNIMSYRPNAENLLGCHNFYPHMYTGLGYDHFIKCSRQFKEQGIRTAAFISSREASFGPWPLSEGLPTLEMHREMDVQVQAKHLFATGLIDDVIVANAFASEEELKSLSRINRYVTSFRVELVHSIPEIEKRIVLEEPHFNRGDVSDYVIRSTQSRVKYKDHYFEPFNTADIKRGDILIDSSLYPRYGGELQIALKDMKNTGRTNVVGRIVGDEVFLLDYIEPWDRFELVENQ